MLSVTEFRILLILTAAPHATVSEMAEALNVTLFTARALLDSLRRGGFLEAEVGRANGDQFLESTW